MHDRQQQRNPSRLTAATDEPVSILTADPELEGVTWVRCADYQAHRSEHRVDQLHGGRWRCFACYPIGGRR